MSKLVPIFIVLAVILTSCSNPVNDDHDDEHLRGIGINLQSSGQTLVTYTGSDSIEGLIEVEAGQMTAGIDFFLISEDSTLVEADRQLQSLTFSIADTSIGAVWQHPGEEGGFEFHIKGKNIGTTNIVFTVYHGDHPDFVSRPIPILVQ